jgi:hypothetical protein
MHTVALTSVFERQARKVGLNDDDVMEIASTVAADPTAGDLIVGTGGARKVRHQGRGKGKSGGYRTVHYHAGNDIPVFLLSIYGKDAKGKSNPKRAE